MLQGAKGNATGNALEGTVRDLLLAKGFRMISHPEWQNLGNRLDGNLLVLNAPYRTIYGHQGKTEFLLSSPKLPGPTRIECKWQQSAGSVDEKLPYLYLNCIEAMPEKHIIIILDGKGWKPGALDWFRNSLSEKKFQSSGQEKTIQFLDLAGFLTWANNKFY